MLNIMKSVIYTLKRPGKTMDINKIRKMFDDKILLTCLSPLFLLRQNKNLIVFSKNLIFILRNLIVFSTKDLSHCIQSRQHIYTRIIPNGLRKSSQKKEPSL